jgi:NAD binding domain of 6-phosphogluconate dehydrogenase
MAASLVRAGVRVLAYDRSEAALAKAVAAGAHAAESPQAIGATPGACAPLSRVLQSYMPRHLWSPVQDRHQGRG